MVAVGPIVAMAAMQQEKSATAMNFIQTLQSKHHCALELGSATHRARGERLGSAMKQNVGGNNGRESRCDGGTSSLVGVRTINTSVEPLSTAGLWGWACGGPQ